MVPLVPCQSITKCASQLHSKFVISPHHVWKYGRQLDIQSPTAENMLGKKMKEEEEER